MPKLGVTYSCSIANCGKPHVANGFCMMHYQRLRRMGTLELVGRHSPAQKYLFDIVLKIEGGLESPCHPWPFFRDRGGYGRANYDGKGYGAHRLVCLIRNGEPPTPQHQAAHLCGGGVRGCCHPGHLIWATLAENATHKVEHGTNARGETNGAKTTEKTARLVKKMLKTLSPTKVARILDLPLSVVKNIRQGRSWAWLE